MKIPNTWSKIKLFLVTQRRLNPNNSKKFCSLYNTANGRLNRAVIMFFPGGTLQLERLYIN